MLNMSELAHLKLGSVTPGAERWPEGQADAAFRELVRGEHLFQAGDTKTCLYRIRTGVLCLYTLRADGKPEVIEFAFPGDLIGLGFLKQHPCNARAAVDTSVTCLPLKAIDSIIQHDPRARSRLADATNREFAFRRATLVEAGLGKPIVRLAAFLLALSRRNRDEGRDPLLIDDTEDCAVVASYLGVTLDVLALTLVQLEMRGAVRADLAGQLRLTGLDVLEDILREATHGPVTPSVEELSIGRDEGNEAETETSARTRQAPLCYSRTADPDGGRNAYVRTPSTGLAFFLSTVCISALFVVACGAWGL